jgi:L-fuculose-phosphate aldolase
MGWENERQAVFAAYQELARKGLVAGLSGNVSLRLGDTGYVAITPHKGIEKPLAQEDILVIDFDGESVEGEAVPSVETLMHLEVYKARPEITAVAHTHSLYATVLAVAGLDLPPLLDELVSYTGGEVRVAEYGFPSTEELARRAVKALEGRRAAFLKHHGLLALGSGLEEALMVAELVERASQIYVLAMLLGRAQTLPTDIIEAEKQLFEARNRPQP